METMHTGDTIPFPTPQKSDTADLSDNTGSAAESAAGEQPSGL